jgi:hypothetical protein
MNDKSTTLIGREREREQEESEEEKKDQLDA